MAIESKKLYNKDGVQFYPETKAEHVISNALGTLRTVSEDLAYINNKVTDALKNLSGGSQVEGNLTVTKKYCISASPTENDMLAEVGEISEHNNNWTINFQLPSNSQPYAWLAILFSWKNIPLDPIYCVTAISAFDRTQIMYTAIGNLVSENSNGGALGGPSGYNTTTQVSDSNPNYSSTVNWTYYFPGISAGTPYGYMAVRYIPAGTQESSAQWKIALFAQYPGT